MSNVKSQKAEGIKHSVQSRNSQNLGFCYYFEDPRTFTQIIDLLMFGRHREDRVKDEGERERDGAKEREKEMRSER